jgi:glucokinase
MRATLARPRATLERQAGAEAVVRTYRERGGGEGIASAEAVFALAERGDAVALATRSAIVEELALGIANAIVVLNPKTVVLGGGLAGAGDALLVPLRERITPLVPSMPELRLSELGADAALVGAAWWAAQRAQSSLAHELEQSVVFA